MGLRITFLGGFGMGSISIGAVPSGEDCEQLGPNYNPTKARRECQAFIDQLRRHFGEEPFGARFRISSNPHDFGTYYEVECRFDENNEEAAEYAFAAEDCPEYWDAEALAYLGRSPHRSHGIGM